MRAKSGERAANKTDPHWEYICHHTCPKDAEQAEAASPLLKVCNSGRMPASRRSQYLSPFTFSL